MHGEGPAEGWGLQGTRGAHVEHAAEHRDAGRVEAQRLVERHRVLPSRKEGMRRGARCGPGGDRAWGGGGASGMHGEGPTQGQGTRHGTRGAHPEHVAYVRDAGRVEAQRLVERRRDLPRVERRAYRAGRGAAREAADDRGASSVQERLDCRLGAGHGEERTANMPSMSVTLEVLKLSGLLNADAFCRESKGGHTVRGGVRPERRRTTAAQAACRGGRDCRIGAGHGEERTQNMYGMSVTLEVSKLSGWLNADAPCRESKGGHTVRGEVRPGRRRTTGAQAACRGGRDCRLGAGHGEELTPNM
eukprot:scaffold125705_cov51-Phaeocystis_antarctica.AAC.2